MHRQSSLRKHHFNYFNHIYELFNPYLSKDFKVKEKSFKDKRTNIIYNSINFATLSLPCFNVYKDLFYNSENIKIVPLNIHKFLTPRGLAY
jgi:LAGLIDADG DNA endonuclease family